MKCLLKDLSAYPKGSVLLPREYDRAHSALSRLQLVGSLEPGLISVNTEKNTQRNIQCNIQRNLDHHIRYKREIIEIIVRYRTKHNA